MTYVIAKKGEEFLDSPVFQAGPTGTEEAIAVFTSKESASRFIEEAGWTDEYEVGELTAIQLLRWVVTAHEQGTQYLAVDPQRQSQEEGEKQATLVIEEQLAAFGEALTKSVLATE